MSDTDQPTVGQRLIGDFAPKLAQLTDDVVFGDIWARPELARRDRSLITVAALITNGSTEQLRGHLAIARTNGLTEAELKEVITHLAFYAAGRGPCPRSRWPGKSSGRNPPHRLDTRASVTRARGPRQRRPAPVPRLPNIR